MRTFANVQELKAAVGDKFGPTEWRTITQEQVNLFADATDDHQWIHVDVERAKEGPFGGTIAHGYLSLSLLPAFMFELVRVDGIQMGVNYGLNKVRFTSPVPVNSKVRGSYELVEVVDVAGGGVQLVVKATIEIEGSERPAAVAETLVRYFF